MSKLQQNKKRILVAYIASMFSVFFLGVIANIAVQLKPNFSYDRLDDGTWKVIQSQSDELLPNTHITQISLPSGTYQLDKYWLLPTMFHVKKHGQYQQSISAEALLYEATQKQITTKQQLIYIVDDDGKKYPVTLRPVSLSDLTLYTWLHQLMCWLVVGVIILTAWLDKLNEDHLVNLTSGLFFSLALICSISGIDRVWAINPDVMHYRFMLGNLSLRIYSFTLLWLLWRLPYKLGKGTLFAYTPFLALLFYITCWGAYFGGLTENYGFTIITSLFIGSISGFFILYIQWRHAYHPKHKKLSHQIALKWMLATITTCALITLIFNVLWALEMADGVHGNLINSSIGGLFKAGFAALLLSHLLYKVETWWWRVWGIFASLSIFLVMVISLAEAGMGYTTLNLFLSMIISTIFGFFISGYFRYRYAKNQNKLLQTAIPKLMNVASSGSYMPREIDGIWCNILNTTFTPQSCELHDTTSKYQRALINQTTNTVRKEPVANILDAGERMVVRGISDHVVVMTHAANGLRLFTQLDAEQVNVLWDIATQSQKAQVAYKTGEVNERKRIANDLHDDIGGKLLYLASQEGDFGSYARETLEDLRMLTRGLSGEDKPLHNILSDLRFYLSQQCERRNVMLSFQVNAKQIDHYLLSGRHTISFNCIISELTRNALQHKQTKNLTVQIKHQQSNLYVHVSNDGAITDPDTWEYGLGLTSVTRRVNDFAGSIAWSKRSGGGVNVDIYWPLAEWLISYPVSGGCCTPSD